MSFTFQNPFVYVNNPNNSNAVSLGKMYIGLPDTDPITPANQIPVYAVQPDGSELEIPQPVRTTAGGVVTYNGTPIQLKVSEEIYSVRIDSSANAQLYYTARVELSGGVPDGVVITVNCIKDLELITEPAANTIYDVVGYYQNTTSGGDSFIFDATRPWSDNNGGTVIATGAIAAWDGTQANIAAILNWTPTGGVGCWVRVGVDLDNLEANDFGHTNTNSRTLVIQKAVDFLGAAGGGTLLLNAGEADFTNAVNTTINLPQGVAIKGLGKHVSSVVWQKAGFFIRQALGFFTSKAGKVIGLTIKNNFGGAVGSTVGAGGIQISDSFGFQLTDVGIFGFSQGTGLALINEYVWTEGVVIDDVALGSCKVDLLFGRRTGGSYTATDSFGYLTIKNLAINTSLTLTEETAILVGDDSLSTTGVNIYNADFLTNIWCQNAASGIKFGSNSYIRDSMGYFRCETPSTATPYTGTFVVGETETAGFRNFTGIIRQSPLSASDNPKTRVFDAKYMVFRDLGEQRNGAPQAAVQWFKCVRLNTDGTFHCNIKMQNDFGNGSNRLSTATLDIGKRDNRGAGILPAFSVVGDGWNAVSGSNWGGRAIIGTESTGQYLYLKRPRFTTYMGCTYGYDKARNGVYEYWTPCDDPLTDPDVTVNWDSLNNDSQQVYVGREMAFAGQRGIATANGGNTAYQLPHAYGYVPEYYNVTAMSADATGVGIESITATSTDIVVTYNGPTPAGTGNIIMAFEIGAKAFNNRFRPT